MSLSDLLPVPAAVPVGRGEVHVVGLSLEAIVSVFVAHRADFEKFLDLNQSLDVTEVAATAPRMVNEILYVALSKKFSVEEVSALPLHLQADILAKCMELTVPDPKKLQGLVSAVFKALQKPPQNASPTSPQLPSNEASKSLSSD